MRELIRTNDIVLVSAVGALLDGADIPHLVLDQNMSVLEGSAGVIPRRILVADDLAASARGILHDAGLSHELRPDGVTPPPVPAPEEPETTDDTALGGRLRLRQPRRGHRFGHDAILLAAATAAHPGEHAIDFGAGVGAAGLALAQRISGLTVTLAEIDPGLCVIAAENARANGLSDRVKAVAIDVATSGAFDAAGIGPETIDRILMNPPFTDEARHNLSPDDARRRAHAASADTLPLWINSAARLLRSGGTVTLIWRADGLARVLDTLAHGFGAAALRPVYTHHAQPAIRIIVQATKGSRAPLQILPGLALNDSPGLPSAAAEAILRDGAALSA